MYILMSLEISHSSMKYLCMDEPPSPVRHCICRRRTSLLVENWKKKAQLMVQCINAIVQFKHDRSNANV